jgi:hypothetical protein
MIESPLIQEIGAEFARGAYVKGTLEVLKKRFSTVPAAITAGLEQVKEEEKLVRLIGQAALCASLEAFEDALRQELPTPPASTRGKRRSRKPPA